MNPFHVKCISSLLLIILATNLFGQTSKTGYLPLLEDGKKWVYKQYGHGDTAYPSPKVFAVYELRGDTVIQTHRSFKLYRTDQAETPQVWSYQGALFEEGTEVYWYMPGEEVPVLLFDFGMQTGERFTYERSNGYSVHEETLFINEIFPVSLDDGKAHLAFFLSTNEHYDTSRLLKWNGIGFFIEGIGSLTDFFSYESYSGGVLLSECYIQDRLLFSPENRHLLFAFGKADGIRDVTIVNNNVGSDNRNSSSPAIFDLTGRRLAAPPVRGLYIEDGRVRLR